MQTLQKILANKICSLPLLEHWLIMKKILNMALEPEVKYQIGWGLSYKIYLETFAIKDYILPKSRMNFWYTITPVSPELALPTGVMDVAVFNIPIFHVLPPLNDLIFNFR